MSQPYELSEDHAQALYSLITEVLEIVDRGKRPGEVTGLAFRMELHLQKIYADALAVKSLPNERCADMLLDLLKFSNPEVFSARQWQSIYIAIEVWHGHGSDMTDEAVEAIKRELEAADLKLHSRESYIKAMREEATGN